jgi:hypothetical protein
MKKWFTYLALFSLFGGVNLSAQDEVFYTDEDDELFNQGKFVGEENPDYLRAIRFERNKNWAIALGTTAIGVATVILVGQHHDKNK